MDFGRPGYISEYALRIYEKNSRTVWSPENFGRVASLRFRFNRKDKISLHGVLPFKKFPCGQSGWSYICMLEFVKRTPYGRDNSMDLRRKLSKKYVGENWNCSVTISSGGEGTLA